MNVHAYMYTILFEIFLDFYIYISIYILIFILGIVLNFFFGHTCRNDQLVNSVSYIKKIRLGMPIAN